MLHCHDRLLCATCFERHDACAKYDDKYLIEKYDKDSLSGFEFAYLKLGSFIKKSQPEQISLFN
ncbi:hypothetical protein GCM10011628_13020 [Lactobacillus acetotolerans DSM 20749 = JCM 3825]|nr:hypothetical protein GCM10011628_13020 [Lactobacillus acetotolerans DSM 20749 = JCM 3825]